MLKFFCSFSGEVERAERSRFKHLSVFLKPQLLCTPYKSYQETTYHLGTGMASLSVPVPRPLLALCLLGSSCRKLLPRASWELSLSPPAADFIWLHPRWWKVICCIHWVFDFSSSAIEDCISSFASLICKWFALQVVRTNNSVHNLANVACGVYLQ